ncbi:hypothetical protein DALLNEIH_03690 [Bacillus sp. B01(2024)]|uniref:ATPase, T2SS/T4P/T4SS family n=1 Tax=Bacillus siamensis TaxID=659243 RepID=UPI0039DF4EE5
MINEVKEQQQLIAPDVLQDIRNQVKKEEISLFLAAFTDPEQRENLRAYLSEKDPILFKDEKKLDYALQELVGLGLIEPLMQDEDITDIGYNSTELIIESNSRPKYRYPFPVDSAFIDKIIQKFASATAGELTPRKPILNAALQKLRLSAVHPNNSPAGPTMALRVTRPRLALKEDNFSDFAPLYVLDFLKEMVKMRANIVIAGDTGTGKTELQKLLMSYIPFEERIILIETGAQEFYAKELFPEKDIFSWTTENNLSVTDLIKTAMRHHPVWVFVSEVLGAEADEMVSSMLTGARVITTAHAANCRAIPRRLLRMAKTGGPIDEKSFLEDVYTHVQLGCHTKKRIINGRVQRYISEIVEFYADGTAKTLFKQVETETDEFTTEIGQVSPELLQRMIEFRADIPLKFTA